MVTRLPLTDTWPWRTSWRAWLRLGPHIAPETPLSRRGLEHTEEVLTRDPLLAGGLLVHTAELLFEHAVDPAGLLLLPQLDHVLALPDAAAAVVTRGGGAALGRALHRVALGALSEKLD